MFCGTLTLTGGYVPPPVIKLEPNDTIVISSQKPMTTKADVRVIQEGFKKLYPDHRIVVLSGLSLSVIREEESSSLPADQ